MGIVAGVSTFLLDHAFNILESAQFGDSQTRRYLMRVSYQSTTCDVSEMRGHFEQVAGDFVNWW
jgi:formyltetrahydrofolate deformylase